MSVQQQLEYWSNLSCQRQMVSWVSRALSLSPDIFVIYIPLPSHSLLSSFFFFSSAKAYSPEFYYDTPNPTLSQKQSKNYSYILQWTQKEPDAVDPILKYRLEVRQVRAAPLVHAFEERTLGAVPSVSPRWLRAVVGLVPSQLNRRHGLSTQLSVH